jgi:predicted house-cleaning noncanonical NTP pyrophosphatase (MazG superfamily)
MVLVRYEKLVRDRIPEVVASNGDRAITRVLDDAEYKKALDNKLLEEVREYLKSGAVEELADIEEVIRAILEHQGVALSDFHHQRRKKAKKRGGFKDRLYLVGVESYDLPDFNQEGEVNNDNDHWL